MRKVAKLSGKEIVSMMRKHRKTIAGLASQMQITQSRVKEVRKRGVAGASFVRDWIQAITGRDPGSRPLPFINSYLSDLVKSQKTIAKAQAKALKKKTKFGLFHWRGDGRYKPADAVKIYKTAGHAEKEAKRLGGDLVVRTLYGVNSRGRKKNSARARKRAKPLFDLGSLPVIGERVLTVDYEGGEGKPAGSRWTHDFKKARAKVYGLPDGSILIKGAVRLWRMFQHG